MKHIRFLPLLLALMMLFSVMQPAALAAREEWGDWDIIKEATCTQTGERIRVSTMGNVQREVIPKKPHKHGPWTIFSEATCTQRAKEEHRCTVCGGGYEWQWTGDLAPHTWGEWEDLPTEPGSLVTTRRRVCKVCGATEEEQYEGAVLPAVPSTEGPGIKVYAQVDPNFVKEIYTEGQSVALQVYLVNTGTIDLFYPGVYANNKPVVSKGVSAPLLPGERFPEEGSETWSLNIHDSGDGFCHVIVSARGEYIDADGKKKIVDDMVTLNLPVAAEEAAIKLHAQVEPAWAKEVYNENDLINLEVYLVNTGNIDLFLPAIEANDHPITSKASGEPLKKGEQFPEKAFGPAYHTHAIHDSGDGFYHIVVSGSAEYTDADGKKQKVTDQVTLNLPVAAEAPVAEPPEEEKSPLKLELVAVNQDADVQPYLLNDVIHFKATATNRSEVPLDEIIIYDPYGLPAKHILNTVLPGEDISADIEYTVSEDDVADGSFSVAIDAVGWAEVEDGIPSEVWAPSVTFDLTATDGSDEYDPLMVLSATHDPYGVLTAGTVIHTHFKAENAGNQTVVIDAINIEPSLRAYQDIDTDFYWSAAGASVPVEGGRKFDYGVVVSQEDIEYGKVVRDIRVSYIWTREDGEEEYLSTNNVHLEFELASGKLHPQVTLSCGEISVGTLAAGQPVYAQMTLTNTGNVPVSYFGLRIASYPGEDHSLSGDGIAAWDEHLNEVLEPGESFQVKHFSNIVPPDLAFGFLSRNLRAMCTAEADKAELEAQGLSDEVWSNWEPMYVDFVRNGNQYVTVVKSRVGDPANGSCYQEGEKIHYHVEVTNNSEFTLTGLVLFDPIFRDAEVPLVSTSPSLPSGETWTVDFDYTVTAQDIKDYTILYNQAQFSCTDPEGGDEDLWALSNVVEAPLGDLHEEPVISLYKHYDFSPANGSYYTPGEKVKFYIEVSNPNSVPLGDLTVRDDMYWSEEMGSVLGYYPTVDPYFSDTLWFEYTIQEPDADQTVIYNTAYAEATADGQQLEDASNTVEVPTGHPDIQNRGPIFSLSVVKEETSAPTHDGKYWIDETIDYKITVTNNGTQPLFNVVVKDTLKTTDGGVLGTIDFMEPGRTETYLFSHKVTKPDEDHGEVYNYAVVDYSIDPPMLDSVTSNPVISQIGKKGGGTDDDPKPTLPEDTCVRTLTTRGADMLEYSLSLCGEHQALLEQTTALIAAAATDEEKLSAYQEANLLWTDEVDTVYDELLAAYPQSGEAILGSKAAWKKAIAARGDMMLKTHGMAEPDAARKLYETLITRTVDLCYALHQAGETKLPESVITSKHHRLDNTISQTASAVKLSGPLNGALRLSVTLQPDYAIIEKLLRKNLTTAETPENLAAMLTVGANSYRTMIAGQLARAAKTASADGLKAMQASQSAAYALLDQDAALWNALWPEAPVAAAEILCRETRELAIGFCAPVTK